MNLHGWIIYNGHLPGDKFIDFAQWLEQSAKHKNITTTLIPNNELLGMLQMSGLSLVGEATDWPDFVLFTDKDIYLARQLEMLGIRVFNPAQAIADTDDKIATYQALAKANIPIPKTLVAPKIFPGTSLDAQFKQQVIDLFGFPFIIKEAFGSFGEQVHLIQNRQDLRQVLNEMAERPFVCQEFITSSYGRDMRLHVVGNHVAAAMTRVSPDDFRSNITAGGSMSAHIPSDEETMLAVKATQAMGADFAGVDLLFGKNDDLLVCEVNSNAHVRNLFDCTGINAADDIIDHVINTMTNKELL